MDLAHISELAQGILLTVLNYFQTGFHHVNGAQGLLVAVVFAYLMPGWQRLPVTAGAAMITHIGLSVMIPVLANGGSFRLPPLVDVEYWKYMAALFAGYLVVVAIFFLLKTVVVGNRGGHSAGHDHGH